LGSCGYLEGGEKMTSEQGNIGPDLFEAACRIGTEGPGQQATRR
jgi:hypothetical protein